MEEKIILGLAGYGGFQPPFLEVVINLLNNKNSTEYFNCPWRGKNFFFFTGKNKKFDIIFTIVHFLRLAPTLQSACP